MRRRRRKNIKRSRVPIRKTRKKPPVDFSKRSLNCGIYKIQSKIKPERCYIGSAVDIKKRWWAHLRNLRNNKHQRILQNHYNKYGEKDLVFSVVRLCVREAAVPLEQIYLDKMKPYFNINTDSSSPLGTTPSAETRQKIIDGIKMKIQEKISIDEFDGKRFQIRLVKPTNQRKAVITHYLHNIDNGVAKHFKKDATKFIKEYVQYQEEENNLSLVAEDALQQLLFEVENVPFPTPDNYTFKFIDLFAGVGGFRLAMQNLGGKCVFTSEWDEQAQKTYRANFGEVPFGDITKEETKKYIPDGIDLLCAGFPCQAFSIAGRRGGFEDTRGTLFFDVAEIIKRKKPKAIFLENVKGLRNHNGGKTLETILNVLRNDLDYFVPEPQIINAKNFGVPQNRERIYIVGFRKDQGVTEFEYPKPLKKKVSFSQVKEKNVPATKYFLSTQYMQTLHNHKARHESKGNGFGFEIIKDTEIANAIVVGGMGRERNLVYDHRITDFTPTTHIKGTVNREGIRKMTPREWARLQGFPDNYLIPVADASAYKQFGNSVAVPAIQATANNILELIGIKNANRK